MLRVEPIGRIDAALQFEIAFMPEFPQDVSGAGAIAVVDLHNPVLVANGNKKIAVIRGIGDGIRVCPVREVHGVAIDIEMIKLVPDPDRIEVLVKVP